MSFIRNGVVARNLQEQVLQNMKDIAELRDVSYVIATYGLKIVGQVDSADDLPSAATYTGNYGDAYAVGEEEPYNYYVFTRPNTSVPVAHWFNIGQLAIEGPQGPQGEQGVEGPEGERGSIWTTASRNPDTIEGFLPDDIWLNTSNCDIYQLISGDPNYWVRVGNIRGTQGIQGNVGPQGPQGPAGAGPQITIGSTETGTISEDDRNTLLNTWCSIIQRYLSDDVYEYYYRCDDGTDDAMRFIHFGAPVDVVEDLHVRFIEIDYDGNWVLHDAFYMTQELYNEVINGINRNKAILLATVAIQASYTFNYLSMDVLPDTIDSENVIHSAKIDLKNIKGNSVVWNQLQERDDFTFNSGTTTFTNGKFTITYNLANGADVNLAKSFSCIANHVYLLHKNKKSDTGALASFFNRTSPWGIITGTNQNSDVIYSYTSDSVITLHSYQTTASNGVAEMEADCIDLTQMFGSGNEPASVDDSRVQWALNYAKEHPAYDAGHIENSKPIKLISRGLNQWDEEWEVGKYSVLDGSKETDNTRIRSKNKIIVVCDETYYTTKAMTILEYDFNNNLLNYTYLSQAGTITLKNNTCYITFYATQVYGTTYNHDICINVSNASLNGTYKPFIKDERVLTLPTLRSAGTVQDDCSKVKVGTYTFTGNESFTKIVGTYPYFTCSFSGKNASNQTTKLLCDFGYTGKSLDTTVVKTRGIEIFNNQFYIEPTSDLSTPEQVASFLTGKTINYELATPTDQPAIELPEYISTEQGGTIEIVYANDHKMLSDFIFDMYTEKAE